MYVFALRLNTLKDSISQLKINLADVTSFFAQVDAGYGVDVIVKSSRYFCGVRGLFMTR
jgi:hypothetical protein